MVGSTIASMIASESIRMVLSAAPIGPCGSRMHHRTPRIGQVTMFQGLRDFVAADEPITFAKIRRRGSAK
jgi:hypothetical protein